jgi:alpha-methylacyl-CoA racemase
VCFAPVMAMSEAHTHPQNVARENFVEVAGITQPAPAPKFSRTPGRIHSPPSPPGAETESALAAWGIGDAEIEALKESGAIGRKG